MSYECYKCLGEFDEPITVLIGYSGNQILGRLKALFGNKSQQVFSHKCPFCGGESLGRTDINWSCMWCKESMSYRQLRNHWCDEKRNKLGGVMNSS